MSDFPQFVQINEEGPREGFQFEKGPISTSAPIFAFGSTIAVGCICAFVMFVPKDLHDAVRMGAPLLVLRRGGG